MNIAASTKISALIKVNPAAIEAIASINRHFEKLRNPLLRKILASRVTLADAARIGGCNVEDFYEKLLPLGFSVSVSSPTEDQQPEEVQVIKELPAFLAGLRQEQLILLDVCEDIASGNDPFLKIMDAVEQVNGSNALLLVNSFEPTPLISILVKRGYSYFAIQKAPDLVHTYFWLQQKPGGAGVEAGAAEISFDEALQKFGEHIRKADVRHLEMPQPMITILSELEQLPLGEALHVTHRRIPKFLIPQVQERGFTITVKQAEPDEVYLLIFRKQP